MERGNGMRRWTSIVVVFIVSFFAYQATSHAGPRVEVGSSVSLVYFFEANGVAVVSQKKQATMAFVVGKGSHPEAFEQQLIGLQSGDKKSFELTADDAFGPYRKDLVKRIPKNQLPPTLKLTEGMMLGPKRGQRPIRVAKILEDSVVLDENHLLAGQTLEYHVQVTDVR